MGRSSENNVSLHLQSGRRAARRVARTKDTRMMRWNFLQERRGVVVEVLIALICAVCFASEARGQERIPVIGPAPPPMKYIPNGDRTQLAESRDVKARLRISIKLAEDRLSRAAQHTEAQQYEAAAAELGIYQALIADAISFMQSNGRGNDKMRDHYKRLEQTLRAHGARLEAIRRTTPSDEAINVRHVFEYTRKARTEALNAFFDDTVVRDAPPAAGAKEKASGDERVKSTPSTPKANEP